MIDCALPKNRERRQCRVILRSKCMSASTSGMSRGQVKKCINKLLYNTPKNLKATDPELLSIVVLRSKKKHFDFLEGRTRWNTTGDWTNPDTGKPFPAEHNVQLDIQFKDRKDELIGKRITELFKAHNKKVVKEDLLYTRTIGIEETSLD